MDIETTTIKEAVDMGRTLCGFCTKDIEKSISDDHIDSNGEYDPAEYY